MRLFHRVLIFTALPHVLVAIAIGILALLNPDPLPVIGELDVVDISIYVHFGLVVAGMIAWVLFRRRGKQEIARGVKWGTWIGVALLLVVFVVASLMDTMRA